LSSALPKLEDRGGRKNSDMRHFLS
jgi:hypothetical protein